MWGGEDVVVNRIGIVWLVMVVLDELYVRYIVIYGLVFMWGYFGGFKVDGIYFILLSISF